MKEEIFPSNDEINNKVKTEKEIMNKKPYIICAAIWFQDGNKYRHQPKNIDNGIVVCGRRHHNCFLTYSELNSNKKEIKNSIQGFLTSDNWFVERKKAEKIAFDAKQIPKITNYLFSEDLY